MIPIPTRRYGDRQPGADVRSQLPPGRQPLHQQRHFLEPRDREHELFLPVYARRDFDEVGTHILVDGNVAGQSRKLITHSARNGFLYTMERANGQTVLAKPYLDNVNWTKGIDQKTGKPIDHDPSKDIQIGFNVPVLVDSALRVIAGYGRLLACEYLGLSEVPTIRLDHLSEAQVRAFTSGDAYARKGGRVQPSRSGTVKLIVR
jgi:hypothetical protein